MWILYFIESQIFSFRIHLISLVLLHLHQLSLLLAFSIIRGRGGAIYLSKKMMWEKGNNIIRRKVELNSLKLVCLQKIMLQLFNIEVT